MGTISNGQFGYNVTTAMREKATAGVPVGEYAFQHWLNYRAVVSPDSTLRPQTTCKRYPKYWHPHYEPCPRCGDTHRVSVGIPGRVMGGVWFAGASVKECRECGRQLEYVPRQN